MLTFCFFGGGVWYFSRGQFFVTGGRGRTAIESDGISRLRCCTQSVLATFSFLHKKSLPTTSSQFHRKKNNKKIANKGIFQIVSRVCLQSRTLPIWSGIVPKMRNFLFFIDRRRSNHTLVVHNAHDLISSKMTNWLKHENVKF